MVILVERNQGMSGKADEVMESGQFVAIQSKLDGLHFSVLDDLATPRWGMAYVDNMKKLNRRNPHLDNASLSSMENQEIAVGETITVIYGPTCRVMTNQFADGLYNRGDKLTIDTATGRLKHAAADQDYFAWVSEEFEGGNLIGRGKKMIPVFFSTPAPLGHIPA